MNPSTDAEFLFTKKTIACVFYNSQKKFHIISKKIILITSLLIICFGAFGQNEAYIIRSTVTGCVNVRSNHDIDASIIACLAAGTPVTVTGAEPFWREIRFGNNKRGWIAKKFIEPATSVPVSNDLTIPDTAFLTIHFIDVGQGDAIWIQTFDDKIDGNGKFEGKSIVIDGGPYSANTNNPVLSYIEAEGYHGADIEALILTHPHIDHFRGAMAIAKHFNIKNYYDPGYPSTKETYLSLLDIIKGKNGVPPKAEHIHIGQANFGQLNWGNELKVEVLYAWNGNPDNNLGDENTVENNSSIVLRIQYGDHVFLFMGDAEGKERNDSAANPKYVEKILLDNEATRLKLKANLLKIAHHGSETSSTLPFIQAVNPDIVIVQSGRKKFGTRFLPDLTTLRRYCANNPNVKIYRTDQGDAAAHLSETAAVDKDNIIITTNGRGQIGVKAFQGGHIFTGNFCGN
jgi:competence protein ComEC